MENKVGGGDGYIIQKQTYSRWFQ